MQITIQPIGVVETSYHTPSELHFACEDGLRTQTESKIVLEKKYQDGLNGLEAFSHLFVLYHLDQAQRLELVTHPGPASITDLPKVGVFASRSQYRPNHIALRLVKLLSVQENTLTVEGLDAIDGSHVFDIKPYVKGFDRPATYKTAPWYRWLENKHE